MVRYTRGSKAHGIEAGEYARVERVNEKDNGLTVKRWNGEQVSYDPCRLHGVTRRSTCAAICKFVWTQAARSRSTLKTILDEFGPDQACSKL